MGAHFSVVQVELFTAQSAGFFPGNGADTGPTHSLDLDSSAWGDAGDVDGLSYPAALVVYLVNDLDMCCFGVVTVVITAGNFAEGVEVRIYRMTDL